MSTTKVNQVSAEKAIATSKANATISFNELFKTTKEKTNGILKTSLGQKTEIYKNTLFDGMNEKKKKAARKKIRNYTYSMLSTIVENKSEKLISAFLDFYKSAYVLNDFSFASIASENTKEEKKEILKKGLEIVKDFNK
nr:MAG: hypothetical protein [Bacteriophage sp.]